MSSKMSETIAKWIDMKEKIAELEKKHEKYRNMIQDFMEKDNITELPYVDSNNKKYSIKKSILHRETLSKKDIPSHLWDQYHKTSSYTMLRLSENEKKEKKEKKDC
jgi:hypothetical protein